MVTMRHGATTTEEHAEGPNCTEDTMTGPRAGEDTAEDRVARLEERMDHMTALLERLLEAQVQGMRAQPQPYVAPMESTGAAVRWTVGERPEPLHGQHLGSEQQASEGNGHARPGAPTGGVGAASSAGAREDRHAGVPTDRVDAKVELLVYDGSINGEKLDN